MEVRVLDDRYDALNRFILFQSLYDVAGNQFKPSERC